MYLYISHHYNNNFIVDRQSLRIRYRKIIPLKNAEREGGRASPREREDAFAGFSEHIHLLNTSILNSLRVKSRERAPPLSYVAQWITRLTTNQEIPGSTPGVGALFFPFPSLFSPPVGGSVSCPCGSPGHTPPHECVPHAHPYLGHDDPYVDPTALVSRCGPASTSPVTPVPAELYS